MDKAKGWAFEEISGAVMVNVSPMAGALSQEDLIQPECDHPACDGHDSRFEVVQKCHPDAQLRASYDSGALALRCIVCDALVLKVAVLPIHERQREVRDARLERRRKKIQDVLDEH